MRKLISISIAIIVMAVGFLLNHPVAAQSQVTTYADVQAEAKRGGYRLIDVDELWQLYQQDDKNLLLVDTRQNWEYYSGHIKNAVNFSMEPTWLARLSKRGELEQFLGPDKIKTIVFY